MGALDHLKCGIELSVDEALKNAEFAANEDLRGAFPMACRVLANELMRLRHIAEKQQTLLMAVKSSDYSGIFCEDVDGGNWFDRRDACVASR